jgi:hypothetical protein
MSTVEHYRFKKGDDLDVIARKHGLKNGDVVWKMPENKALAAKRKKPEALEPGDDIALPVEGEDSKAEKAAVEHSLATVTAAMTEVARTLQKYDQIQHEVDQTRVETTKQLLAVIKRVEGDAKAINFSADVLTTLGTGLSKLCISGAKAATLKGAELAAANKEIVKDGLKLTYMPLQKAWQSGMISFSNAGSQAIDTVEMAANWMNHLTEPSWWAAKLTGGDPTDSIRKLIGENNAHASDLINNINAKRKAVASHLVDLDKVKKQLEAKAKELH